MMTTYFADIILPLPLPKLFTYRIPREMESFVIPFIRVVVPFGKNKLYAGIVAKIHQSPPEQYQAKYIDQVVDERPILTPENFKLWNWISEYYISSLGSVMNAALPSGFKISSETIILRHPDLETITEPLSDKEYLILEALEAQEQLTLKEVSSIIQQQTVLPLINQMIKKRYVLTDEDLKLRYKPKVVSYVRLAKTYRNETALNEVLNQLVKAPKQMEALMQYLRISGWHTSEKTEVKRSNLSNAMGKSASTIKTLIDKNILELYEREEGRLNPFAITPINQLTLNAEQLTALEKIKNYWDEKKPVLLHGVTSSGKTEVYIQLIKEHITSGKQSLFLVPEIALTTQLVNRLKAHFGSDLGVYHSRFTDNERVETWNAVLQNKYKIVVGARSSLFLPFNNLGLIIVDEEQESSFKQFDPAPRYHARDAAIVLAQIASCNILLGTATPSFESQYNSLTGKYGRVEMHKRFGDRPLPKIQISDLKAAYKEKNMHGSIGPELYQAIARSLENKEQVILFRNRRGFAPRITCTTCGWTPDCKNCDITLTYHKFRKELICHYCGYHHGVPKTCGACGSTQLVMQGQGTEKIEEEISEWFPHARVARMDLDTTRQKHSYQKIISDFEEHQIDVLIGTQMLSKGLDFDHVGLVGIMSAESMLHYPDFRAYERAYQLMEQVAGRAGRKHKKGKVIIQTFEPDHPVILQVQAHDYNTMYKQLLPHRKQFSYPPYFRLIRITLKHKDVNVVKQGASYFAQLIRPHFKGNMLGPEPPSIARIRNQYLENILLKLPYNQTNKTQKRVLVDAVTTFNSQKDFKSIRVILDVDPV